MRFINILKANKGVVLLAVAVGFGVLSVLAARSYVGEQVAAEKARLKPNQVMVDVVVSKAELPRGHVVDNASMAVRSIPKEYVVSGSITPDRFEGYQGNRLTVAMRPGEPLMHQSIEGADVTTFSAKVKTGIRAMTIAVDEVNSVSGMLQPGDRVDLLLSVKPPSAAPGGANLPDMTASLMQDLIVLATGKQVRPGAGENGQARTFTTVTVEVSPTDAQRLVVAQRNGKLTALLRNPGDREALAQKPMDIYSLLQLPTVKPVQNVSASPEMIVGGRGVIARQEQRIESKTDTKLEQK